MALTGRAGLIAALGAIVVLVAPRPDYAVLGLLLALGALVAVDLLLAGGVRPLRFQRGGERLVRLGEPVTVVFDGRASAERPAPGGTVAGRLWVAFAPGGRDAADDEIAERVARVGDPAAIRVVTSDKGLSERVREHGVEVIPVGRFRRMLDGDA